MSVKYRAHPKKLGNGESGMVAIMVTLILMMVISLIVMGFAQISRRNQRQALDRQLSTQAFYAAETGINDVAELIKTATESGTAVAAKPDCASNGGGFYTSLVPVLDAANSVQYTCLIVNPTPTSLVYSSVGSTSTIIPLTATSGTIASLTITWQSKDATTTPATNCPASKTNVFSPTVSWDCGYGVLRFDLVPTTGSLSVGGLQSSTMTTFAVPLNPTGAGDASSFGFAAGSNALKGIVCSQTSCTLTITGLTQSQYYLRASSLYKNDALIVSASDGTGTAISLQGAQAVIDATGKAQDVLRRVQVRAPLSGSSTNRMGDFAIQSAEALCKRFAVMDGFFQSDANNVVPGVGASTANPLCQ